MTDQQPTNEFGATVNHLTEVLTNMAKEASKGLYIFNSKIHPDTEQDDQPKRQA